MATFESNVLVKVNLSRIKVHQRKDPISWQLSNFLFKVNFEDLKLSQGMLVLLKPSQNKKGGNFF